MNTSDLAKVLSEELEAPLRKTEEIVDTFFETLAKELLSGGRIEIRGFGSLSVRDYDGYTGRNPKTCEKTSVPPKKLPFFKVGKDFRERLARE